jgi:hypothetical protein
MNILDHKALDNSVEGGSLVAEAKLFAIGGLQIQDG